DVIRRWYDVYGSGGAFEGSRAASGGPSGGGNVLDLPVGHRRQAGEDVTQVIEGIDGATAAALDDREEDGGALAGVSRADEEPVLFADGGGSNGVFHRVVVDFDVTVVNVNLEQ